MSSWERSPQAPVERWGDRARLRLEGTHGNPGCQCGQASTSTSDLRVRALYGPYRNRHVEVLRPSRSVRRERRQDLLRYGELQRFFRGIPEAELEAGPQRHGELSVADARPERPP